MNSFKVMLGLPGPVWTPGAMLGVIQTTAGHRVDVVHEGASWDNFNILWGRALARAKAGDITHFAQLHADMAPEPNWLDVLIEEMDKKQVSFLSAIPALKDKRLLTSCGIGNPASEWTGSFRRLTVWEMARREWRVPGRGMVQFGETFDAGDLGYPDKFMLHNNGCFVADLRDERFFMTDGNGELAAFFHFVKRMRPVEHNGNHGFALDGESEDWAFSRRIHLLGIHSAATSRVFLNHGGFPNRIMQDKERLPWFQDEESRRQWDDTLDLSGDQATQKPTVCRRCSGLGKIFFGNLGPKSYIGQCPECGGDKR